MRILAATMALGLGLTGAAQAQSWDMPTPYGDATFHTQNIMQFAEEVEAATDGALTITVHSAGSLFPHGEIKNAVRSGQVPLGEFFLSTLANEDIAYGLDSQPFLATSYEDARKLWDAQGPVVEKLLAEQGLMPLFTVPWATAFWRGHSGRHGAPSQAAVLDFPHVDKLGRWKLPRQRGAMGVHVQHTQCE